MRTLKFALVAALVAGPALSQPAPPKQFDLVCAGWKRGSAIGPKAPYEVRYAFDLDAKMYCGKGCGAIKDVTPSRITLSELDAGRTGRIFYVERMTGKLVDFYVSPMIYDEREAACEAAPFTPFPAGKF